MDDQPSSTVEAAVTYDEAFDMLCNDSADAQLFVGDTNTSSDSAPLEDYLPADGYSASFEQGVPNEEEESELSQSESVFLRPGNASFVTRMTPIGSLAPAATKEQQRTASYARHLQTFNQRPLSAGALNSSASQRSLGSRQPRPNSTLHSPTKSSLARTQSSSSSTQSASQRSLHRQGRSLDIGAVSAQSLALKLSEPVPDTLPRSVTPGLHHTTSHSMSAANVRPTVASLSRSAAIAQLRQVQELTHASRQQDEEANCTFFPKLDTHRCVCLNVVQTAPTDSTACAVRNLRAI